MDPQIVRMGKGITPDNPRFAVAWEDLLCRLCTILERAAKASSVPAQALPERVG